MPKIIYNKSRQIKNGNPKNVKQGPKRPRENPRTIVHPSCEKYFPSKFHNFCAKYAEEHEHYEWKIYTNIYKKLSERPRGGPTKVPRLLYNPLVKNISIIFAQNMFHHFEISLRWFSTLWCRQGLILYRNLYSYKKNQWKTLITRTFENIYD